VERKKQMFRLRPPLCFPAFKVIELTGGATDLIAGTRMQRYDASRECDFSAL